MTLLGIDGCRGGWVVAEAREDLSRITFSVERTAEDVIRRISAEDFAAIDIPIGLPASRSRQCDMEARRLLSPEGARVFSTPARVALDGRSFEECCQLNESAVGKKLSLAAHGFLPKIAEVDACITPELQARIRETHPEVVFLSLAGRVLAKKKSTDGHRERLDVLLRHGVDFDVARALMRLGRGVAVDDLLDAAACLFAARAVARGEAQVLGSGEVDARGLRMEMVTPPLRQAQDRTSVERTPRSEHSELERIITNLRGLQAAHPKLSATWAYYEMALMALRQVEVGD